MTHPREDALLRSIDDRRDDLVELTQALIRIPASTRPARTIATASSCWASG